MIALGATEVHWDRRPADADYVILATLRATASASWTSARAFGPWPTSGPNEWLRLVDFRTNTWTVVRVLRALHEEQAQPVLRMAKRCVPPEEQAPAPASSSCACAKFL